MCTESVMPSNHLILCPSLLLIPSIFPSIRVYFNESTLPIRWWRYQSFSFRISHSSEYSELISFRIDCFDILAVQGTLKSSPTPQLESISSSTLSLLCGTTITTIHDYLKKLQLWQYRTVPAKSYLCFLICCLGLSWAQMVKNLPAMWETRVQTLGWEDPLEEEMATHSSILAWRIPWTEESRRLASIGSHRVGEGWSDLAHLLWNDGTGCHYLSFLNVEF